MLKSPQRKVLLIQLSLKNYCEIDLLQISLILTPELLHMPLIVRSVYIQFHKELLNQKAPCVPFSLCYGLLMAKMSHQIYHLNSIQTNQLASVRIVKQRSLLKYQNFLFLFNQAAISVERLLTLISTSQESTSQV